MASSCEEIDAALARLGGKVDGLNNTINGLKGKLDALEKEQARCCKNKQDKGFDPTPIYKRLNELEVAVKKIVDYVNVTDTAIKAAK
ncbi:MAG: hypothetical protein HC907_35280 [Richelia sp. SM1_7_0]|nr:hypothetical protein [Richelia sp. SM1_7_0]